MTGKTWRVIGAISGFIVGGAIPLSGRVSTGGLFVGVMSGGAIGLLLGAVAFLIYKHRQLFRIPTSPRYSLRSLMILVTLCCVLLGGFAARADYLRRWAEFHEREAERMVSEAAAESGLTRQRVNEEAQQEHRTKSFYWYIGMHRRFANEYRAAMYRPWIVVDEWIDRWPEPKPLKQSL